MEGGGGNIPEISFLQMKILLDTHKTHAQYIKAVGKAAAIMGSSAWSKKAKFLKNLIAINPSFINDDYRMKLQCNKLNFNDCEINLMTSL